LYSRRDLLGRTGFDMRKATAMTVLLISVFLLSSFPTPIGGDSESPTGNSGGPIPWYKMGMVQNLGIPGEPDDASADSGSVMFDDGMYKLWYSGFDGAHWRVLYSTSPDGLVWMKYGVVVDLGLPGAMDDDCVMAPFVMKNESGGFKMWYTAQSTSSFGWRIMYATSDDGLIWQKHGVVLSRLGRALAHPSVLIDSSGLYRMWYSEYDTIHWRINYATSDDGVVWTEQGVVLDVGAPGDPDSLYVYFPVVIVEPDGTHLMYYSAADETTQYLDILYATSPDGKVGTWQKIGLALPHGEPGDHDSFQATPTSMRIREDGLHELWYTGYDLSVRRMMMALEVGEVPIHLKTNVVNDNDVLLNWTIHGRTYIDHYLIYRSPDQRAFDFTDSFHSTANDSDPLETSWIDVNAAGPGSSQELYYVIRAVYSFGRIGVTSNTAGKWTKQFSSGPNTFSLPLEPFEARNLSWYADNIPNVSYVRWMNPTGKWVTHNPGTGEGTDDIPTEMGRGYEAYLTSDTRYTFCGSPASMIRYREGVGDTMNFRMSLSAHKFEPNLILRWNSAEGASGYRIFRSVEREGLHDTQLQEIDTVPSTQFVWMDSGVLSTSGEYYYTVVPVDSAGELGSSTYSIGSFTVEYQSGSDAFAVPLKPNAVHSLDWYCDGIPDTVGMAYMVMDVWKFHSVEMPAGVYDTDVMQGDGYQISVGVIATGYTFIGY
jgi:hypothetical protein